MCHGIEDERILSVLWRAHEDAANMSSDERLLVRTRSDKRHASAEGAGEANASDSDTEGLYTRLVRRFVHRSR